MPILRLYRELESDDPLQKRVLNLLESDGYHVTALRLERCFHVETAAPLAQHSRDEVILRWLLKQPQDVDSLRYESALPRPAAASETLLIEIGPRFNFSTAFSTNCVNICQNLGMDACVQRLEMSTRYLIRLRDALRDSVDVQRLIDRLGDRMTECRYTEENLPVASFDERLPSSLAAWRCVPLLSEGRKALDTVNAELGLAFSEWDIEHYMHLFCDVLHRDPTTVELFDCAQSNSEHSRHWFFRGKLIVDGVEQPQSLIRMVMETQQHSNANNTIMFSDNSSAIRGYTHRALRAEYVDGPGAMVIQEIASDLIFTAETHNMPTAVAPFSGATTGTGGRLRDVQAVGRGAWPIAGTAGYSVGNLNVPGYAQPYEDADWQYPSSFARPLQVLIEASNGASDYGNKFGEPVIAGFVHSYGVRGVSGERDEYVKPIMFSGGLGTMPATMRAKLDPQRGMLLAKIGGPVYRIGVGGGAASSVEVQGSGDSDLDFNAVQRGDAEMENKLNRVVRACIELGSLNPILAIHDQGAGGNGNVLKELVEPGFAGAVIFSKEFQLGDPTITALELWGAEYQENNALLCRAEDRALLERICARERCPISFVGVVTGDGRVRLVEGSADFKAALAQPSGDAVTAAVPFDLELKHVLGDMPKREYCLDRVKPNLQPLKFPADFDCNEALRRVLSLVTVGSKRYLTNKVDRCVTGLVAQQQCVGPLHTPLADYGLVTVSHFGREGIATAIGTQPIKGLLDATAMARMCVAEALSNLVFVRISELGDVKCSANWMWAAKLPGEGAKLYDACRAMCDIMQELHIAVDGGKDSLSMAAKVGTQVVKSPGTLVVSVYAPCDDVTVKVTPDLKGPAAGVKSALLWINIEGKFRLGASALAQSYCQQGDECPTVLNAKVLASAFNVTQTLLAQGKLLAGHDISDGGLLVCLLEMAFGGLSGLDVDLTTVLKTMHIDAVDAAAATLGRPDLAVLFAEECGWVLEIESSQLASVQQLFTAADVPNYYIGTTNGLGLHSRITVACNGATVLANSVRALFKQWEATSFELEKLQANKECAVAEFNTLDYRTGPQYRCHVDMSKELAFERLSGTPIRVAVLREEGVNSDREMMFSLMQAKFEVHDITMSDLLAGKITLQHYRGLVFPGGFSYADTLGSAKGWASNIVFSKQLVPQFQMFKNRIDTFSLGICNGCQLMSLIGWVGDDSGAAAATEAVIDVPDVALLDNRSGRFECRWTTVRVAQSNAIMLRTLQDSVLGCWAAHGEGRFSFRNADVLKNIKAKGCVTLHYVDDNGEATEKYPMNPNGSEEGIAGLCSTDGRHLALMPHPERCGLMYQWPYVPHNFNVNSTASPWQLMFNDAYKWCKTSC